MGIIRLVVIALAIGLALFMIRRLFKPSPRPDKTGAGPTKNMVKCAQCGLHLPEAEAIVYQGPHEVKYYCCQEHRRQHTSSP